MALFINHFQCTRVSCLPLLRTLAQTCMGCLVCLLIGQTTVAQPFSYPLTDKQPVTDTIWGQLVVDNYRWMEEPNSLRLSQWLKAQADYTNQWLDRIPGRDTLLQAYKTLDQAKPADISLFLLREGGRYFFVKTEKGENVGKLYYREDRADKDVLLFDPHSVATPSTKAITFTFLPSKDGKKVALALTQSGRLDVRTVKIIQVDTKAFYPDSLYPVHSLQAWSADSQGLLYGALPTGDLNDLNLFNEITIRYHQIGKSAQQDPVIVSQATNPEMAIKPSDLLFNYVGLSPDSQYLTLALPKSSFYAPVADLGKKPLTWKPLLKGENRGPAAVIYREQVYFVANDQVLVAPLQAFDPARARVIIPSTGKRVEWVKVSRDYLFALKFDGISTTVDQHNFKSGKTEPIRPPYPGNAWLYTLDATTNECIINMLSWQRPLTRFAYDPLSRKSVRSSFDTNLQWADAQDLIAEEVVVDSHDGIRVPLSLIYKKGLKRDGKNIVLMSGYGAYGSTRVPFFSDQYLPLLKKGIIVAITHVRGGGEQGEAWHKGGYKATKPNTWKDFIACGDYLIAQKYTSPQHLVGEGFSAGGILIGRAMTERPDLFGATLHHVPLSNPLRGENRPNGVSDANEFGTVADSTEAMGLLQMDTYLHIKTGVSYPAVLATAGVNDSRVPVWQPAKLVAALQSTRGLNKPVLLLVNYDSGHMSEEKFITFRTYANQFAFALWQAGHPQFQPVLR